MWLSGGTVRIILCVSADSLAQLHEKVRGEKLIRDEYAQVIVNFISMQVGGSVILLLTFLFY